MTSSKSMNLLPHGKIHNARVLRQTTQGAPPKIKPSKTENKKNKKAKTSRNNGQ